MEDRYWLGPGHHNQVAECAKMLCAIANELKRFNDREEEQQKNGDLSD